MLQKKRPSVAVRSPTGSGNSPAYCLHQPSGRAVVYLRRRAVYLGEYGSPESREAYRRIVAEFRTPESRRIPAVDKHAPISVAALVEQYLAYASNYYGKGNEYLHTVKAAVAPLLELFASSAVDDFDGDKLELLRAHRINQGRKFGRKKPDPDDKAQEFRPIARVYINRLISIIVRIFRWGARKKLAPSDLWCELKAVESLKKGTFPDLPLRECTPIKPVPTEHVEAVLDVVSPEIAAMIRLQLLTAMRPDEVTAMRPCDIDTAGKLWTYTIGDRAQGGVGHKTDYLDDDGDKVVYLGKNAQRIIKPFLSDCILPTDFFFSPRRAAERRYPNGNRGLKPKAKYNDDTYCRAVKRGCKRAGVPIWTPNRLRHNRATEVRTTFGLDAAQAVLDHRSIETTQIYAERQTHLKREVALKIG